jgi:hypothetical protein
MTINRTAWLGLVHAGVMGAAAMGCVGAVHEEQDTASTEALLSAGEVSLVRQGSGKCLGVENGGTDKGDALQQQSCSDSSAQAFVLDRRSNGNYRLTHVQSSRCVVPSGGGTGNRTSMVLGSCSSSSAQFRVEDVGAGFVRLVGTRSGRCLDVDGAANGDGVKVQLWDCNGTVAQSWNLDEGAGGDGDTGDGDSGGDGDTGTPPTDPPPTDPGGDNLVWRNANLTNFTSYPEPGSEECREFNGCTWAGQFAFVSGKQSESWVQGHNIIAVHSRDASAYRLKTLRLRQGNHQIDATVSDMCSDSDCSGCCTQNARETGFLIDVEKYTMERFGAGDGIVQWACLDCN